MTDGCGHDWVIAPAMLQERPPEPIWQKGPLGVTYFTGSRPALLRGTNVWRCAKCGVFGGETWR